MDHLSQFALQGYSAYLKIADGCSRRCAFCTIPNIKGDWHSRPVDKILEDAARLNDEGIKELILIAQDTTSYGIDRGEKDALPGLLEKILTAAPNVPWIRILYAFPGFVSDHLIDLMAGEPRILPYLDIPLQHAHPDTLKRMLRPSDMDSVRRTLEYMRKRMPEIAIRSTFITGFPGETEEEFTALYQFIEAMEFDRVGVFPYYAEKDTPSAAYADDVPEEEDAAAPEAPAAAEVPVENEEVLQEETVMPKPPFMTSEERTLELQEPPIPQPTVFSDEMREIRQQESVPAEVVKDADDVVDDVSDFFKPEA